MKKYWKAIGIAVVAAGVLYNPVVRLYKYMQAKKNEGDEDEGAVEHHIIKTFAPAYRGKHKVTPHHKPKNGHMDAGPGLA